MAIASKKKTRKGAGKAKAKPASKAVSKAKGGATKTGASKTGGSASSSRSSTGKQAAEKTAEKAGKKAAKKAIVEPERSAPAMAEVDADVLEFIAAIDDFKKQHGRPFPSWSEVLLIVRQLGYERS